ncbi:MAG TPA: hypothetical protein DGG95_02515 [Cytophagales bacterium]|nr:hypothetical protein [Cytophagales bacterium]
MLAVVLIIILLLFFTIRAIANIKPREWTQSQTFTEQPKNVMNKDETITIEEYMRTHPTKMETVLTENNCIKNTATNQIMWCEK